MEQIGFIRRASKGITGSQSGDELYRDRPISLGYPELEKRGVEFHAMHHASGSAFTEGYLCCLERLVNLHDGNRRTIVVGCGPKPHAILELRSLGLDAIGLEPVPGIVASARAFAGDETLVRVGSAEDMPFEDGECRVVWMTSVLEHVDSPGKSLRESYRVLEPGGVLFVYTTNRWKVSLKGFNGEYRTPFFNFFPRSVQESYVFKHLHYQPDLANYNPRPAVHWFSYSRLCELGREAGFGGFYSWIDLVQEGNPLIANSKLRQLAFQPTSRNPWMRAVALTQAGGCVFMLKRPNE